MKRIIAFMLAMLIAFLIPSALISAHEDKITTPYKCVELCGWDVDEKNHINSTAFKFKFDNTPSLSADLKSSVRNGAQKWSNVATITEVTSISPNEKWVQVLSIPTYPKSGIIAATKGQDSSTSTGHATYFTLTIVLDQSSYFDSSAAAHEFGHVFGLADVYENSNRDKLMYGYVSGTASSPTERDLNGFSVITGQHVKHTFDYTFYRPAEYPSYTPIHRRFCTFCHIAKDGLCSPQTGRCTTCGFTH